MPDDWLAPIRAALDARPAPCAFFFRDDDAGWNDLQLFDLLDCFAQRTTPIDLAVIPAALTPTLAERLLERMKSGDMARPGVHQHGYAHANHQRMGRKCEFGTDRNRIFQHEDIRVGHMIMEAAFRGRADPIFTPPWNRCTTDTVSCLRALGFEALSRDLTATPFTPSELREIPIAVDWCRLRPPGTAPRPLAERIACCIAFAPRVGIMLHHAVMDQDDLALLDGLLDLLRTHPMARCVGMRTLLHADAAGARGVAPPTAKPSSSTCPQGFAE